MAKRLKKPATFSGLSAAGALAPGEELGDRFRRTIHLSRRETQSLALAVRGLSTDASAKLLGISVKTVEVYRMRVLEKFECSRIITAGYMAGRAGFSPEAALAGQWSGEIEIVI